MILLVYMNNKILVVLVHYYFNIINKWIWMTQIYVFFIKFMDLH